MDELHYKEMKENFLRLEQGGRLSGKNIYLFGHCNATEELADLFLEHGFRVAGIPDNSRAKHGLEYRGIPVVSPETVRNEVDAVVCIATRFYEAMNAQLRGMGFAGEVVKLVDYNTYAEYSLAEETIKRKRERAKHGWEILSRLKETHDGAFLVFCPFAALGDVYFCMSYLPYFLKKRGVGRYVVCVVGRACAKVAALFGAADVEVFAQKELDAAVQAALFYGDKNSFIAHQDRPYVVNLQRALSIKKIPLEEIYKSGVFGLSRDTKPVIPANWREYSRLDELERGKSVILSPYAKSVTALPAAVWEGVVADYKKKGYRLFTNVAGEEEPLPDTLPISPDIAELKSVMEYAGTFVGIRSGLCDVIRTADCKKIALYPDYNYCDTKWKAVDMYRIEGFENIVV